ncbi:MAG: hypothetical protein NTZ21_13255 [Actinobacteria bacterium]|jgi:hypothetical protein|nr:hypothetical protein [Actinomycetota bacterium]
MRTRTLLLLAVACGLVILVAGGIQLWRFAGESEGTEDDLPIGASASAGDLDVTVLAAEEADGLLRVTVRLSGVDDPAGIDDFRLIVAEDLIEPLTADQAGDTVTGACAAFTVAEQTCDLVFGTAQVDNDIRVLLVRRGEDRHRWALR